MEKKINNKISACLIVMNEEKRIGKVIKNIRDYVDEIVIVDGGSIDNTVAIAKKMGAQVFFRKWNNDFGAQRNFAIRKAKGGWVFIIDADETASAGLLGLLRGLVKVKDIDGFGITRKNYINKKLDSVENTKINLFRSFARYNEKIHEQPRGLKRVLIIYDKNVYLNHYKTDNDQVKHLMHYYQILENNLNITKSIAKKKKYNKLLEITKKDMRDIMKKHDLNKDLLPLKFKKIMSS